MIIGVITQVHEESDNKEINFHFILKSLENLKKSIFFVTRVIFETTYIFTINKHFSFKFRKNF